MVQNKNDNAVVIGMPLSCEVFMSPITSQIKSRLCVTGREGPLFHSLESHLFLQNKNSHFYLLQGPSAFL